MTVRGLHDMAHEGGTKAIVAALFANMGIAVTKFIAYLLTHSSSMLAESVHSLADSGNQVLLLLGGRRARREATPEHPFGYGRARYVYAFLVSIILFSLGGLFALYESWHKFQDPHAIDSWHWVPIVVLVSAIVMESFSFRTAVVESNRVRGRLSWREFVQRSKSPELPVILLEDLGALVGLVLALVGVSMTLVTGNGLWDAAGTASIGVLLILIAIILGIEVKSLLIGEAATPENVAAVRAALEGTPGVESVIHLRTMHLGPEEILVAAKIEVVAAESAADVAAEIDAAEAAVRAAVPGLKAVIYLEPDLRRAVEAAASA